MRAAVVATATASLTVAFAASALALTPPPVQDQCSRNGSLTYAKSDRWRVFREFRIKQGKFSPRDRIYACRQSSGDLTRLRFMETEFVEKVRLATVNGDFFAFTQPAEDGGNVGLTTVDLRSAAASQHIAGPTDIVVTKRGCTAWIEAEAERLIFKAGFVAGGSDNGPDNDQAIARGPGIGAKSLKLSGTTASWTQDGQKRTADLRTC